MITGYHLQYSQSNTQSNTHFFGQKSEYLSMSIEYGTHIILRIFKYSLKNRVLMYTYSYFGIDSNQLLVIIINYGP
jgi:hypothetical protein